ncbi:hypothetical protein LX99_01876 [Mucilaginibacter oryzae]|uniref:Putative auto-transporter adhesin head GIN domain-containing protein n=1 Tax=Mucilaginibacter oryzae TaxID=468058 RepID=A0A316HBY4_9SPHI|nr:DUF2807 domain-containing protein [Mucilaginibacter oryzae]PWK78036.1 hypothetical protein LX99_01876 [Mucilaginibacter oryzae]
MKTTLIAIAAVLFMVPGFAKSANANSTTDNAAVVLTNVSNINKIEVYGNVELYVSSGPADQVKVYNHYYAESALVQSKKGVLRISSYKNEKLVVWVTANQLSAITAYDNAEIKSFGSLNSVELNVKLYNNASAALKLDTYAASISLAENAKAELSGTTNEYSLTRTPVSNVNSNGLSYAHATETLNRETKRVATEYATL